MQSPLPPSHPHSHSAFTRCPFSRCSSFVSKALLLSPSCQTISMVSKVFGCCLNSYRSAIITAFSFSPLMCVDNRGLGGSVVVKKRMHSESERISGHLAAPNVHIAKRGINQSGSRKHCCGCQEMQCWYFLSFFSLSLCVSRPWIFLIFSSSLIQLLLYLAFITIHHCIFDLREEGEQLPFNMFSRQRYY